MKYITSLAAFFFLLGCNSSEQSKTEMKDAKATILNCKLPWIVQDVVALGFPKIEGLVPSTGKVNATILFVDFSDVPANESADSIFSVIGPSASDFFKETSYGRLEFNFTPHLKWLRLSKPSEHYGKGIYKGQSHLDFIQEAVNLADSEVDFSKANMVVVISSPEAKAIEQGPTFKATDPQYQIKADGASIPVGITSGYDLNIFGGTWLPHETGHGMGLPDLYHFGEDSLNRYVGTFGLMGPCYAKAPGYFAFERWMLGWLDDSQIFCHQSGEAIVALKAIENIGGIKAVVVPLDTTTALVVESRRKIGFDKNMPKEGALVYVVNTSLPGGSGPIQVKPGANNGNEMLEDAPMAKGDTYTFRNVSVEILQSDNQGDQVRVKVN